MRLVIEVWWNRVSESERDKHGWFKVLPDFILKDKVFYPNGGGWKSRAGFHTSLKRRKNFKGVDELGRAKFDLPTSYGIGSYQLVYLEGD